jgi:CDP-diacylglycerol--serine O-phosphatidyltransferase
LVAFLYVSAGAVRLARFNVISTSTTGQPSKPGRHILGLPIPCAAAGLVAIVTADRAAGGLLARPENTGLVIAATFLLSLFMVSTLRFRSFKDLRFDFRSILFVLFTLGTSAFVWHSYRPEFVLVWLLLMYVVIGFLETTKVIAARIRQMNERKSVPPAV